MIFLFQEMEYVLIIRECVISLMIVGTILTRLEVAALAELCAALRRGSVPGLRMIVMTLTGGDIEAELLLLILDLSGIILQVDIYMYYRNGFISQNLLFNTVIVRLQSFVETVFMW